MGPRTQPVPRKKYQWRTLNRQKIELCEITAEQLVREIEAALTKLKTCTLEEICRLLDDCRYSRAFGAMSAAFAKVAKETKIEKSPDTMTVLEAKLWMSQQPDHTKQAIMAEIAKLRSREPGRNNNSLMTEVVRKFIINKRRRAL